MACSGMRSTNSGSRTVGVTESSCRAACRRPGARRRCRVSHSLAEPTPLAPRSPSLSPGGPPAPRQPRQRRAGTRGPVESECLAPATEWMEGWPDSSLRLWQETYEIITASMLAACSMRGAGALLPLAFLAHAALSSAYVTSPASLSGFRTTFSSSVSKSRRAYPLSWARALRATATKPDQKSEGLGFDSHKAVDRAPDTLCRDGTANTAMRAKFEKMLREAQDYICKSVENVDGGAKFQTDAWTREGGGGGISRVLANGKVWEKAGCNLSVVYGSMPAEALQAANDRLKFGATDRAKGYAPGERVPFFACGLSSVRARVALLETEGGVWWFGGGTDITPAYLNEDDMKYFHGTYKEVCDKHDPEFYSKFKKWADEYFFIK
eukprot:762070-Hanusia_phi.AAC.2